MTALQQFRTAFTICLVGLAVVGVVVGSGGAGAAVVHPSESSAVATVTGDDTAETNETSGTNATTPHRNPETVSEDGDTDRVAAYLSGQLSGLIGASTQNISAGQYDQARSLLGDEYNETLSQYISVTGDTGSETSAEDFERAQENAAELAALRAEFDATRQAYETAVDNGETQRARRLARELATLAERIDGVSVQLATELNDIENATGTNLSSTETTVLTVQESTTETATAVSDTEFTATDLTATLSPSRFSFATPTTVSGTLYTAAGDPVQNQSVTLRVGERLYDTETNATGQFSVQYRPVFLPMNATTVPIRFVPGDISPYQSANTTVAGQVTTQTASTLLLNTTQLSTAPGQPLVVNGTVTAGTNTTLAGVPVVVDQAGQQLGTTETATNGSFALPGTVPLDTPRGAIAATVRVPLSDAAVAGSTRPVNLTVTEAPTQLTLSTNLTGTQAPSVGVSGTLTLASGTPLSGEPVTIYVDDTAVVTTTTGPNGRYTATVPTSALDSSVATPSVRAVFTADDRALAESRTTATVELPAAFTTTTSWLPQPTPALLGGAAVAVVLLIAGGLGRHWQWRLPWRSRGNDTGVQATAADSSASPPGQSTPSPDTSRAQALLAHAEESLATDDPTTAVQVAYASLRSALAPTLPDSRTDTHWEFYNRCQNAGIDPIDETEAVTAAYEEATFAPAQIPPDRAQQVIETVSTVIDEIEPDQTSAPSRAD